MSPSMSAVTSSSGTAMVVARRQSPGVQMGNGRVPPRGWLFFVESADVGEGRVKNVFITSKQHGKTGVVVSNEGYMEVAPNGDRFAVLLNGRRYEGTPGTPEYRVTEFERYAARIQSVEQQVGRASPKTISRSPSPSRSTALDCCGTSASSRRIP